MIIEYPFHFGIHLSKEFVWKRVFCYRKCKQIFWKPGKYACRDFYVPVICIHGPHTNGDGRGIAGPRCMAITFDCLPSVGKLPGV